MIFLQLFLSFFKIGLFSFGGGAGMIALLQEEVAAHGWMSADKLASFIGVSESTPGPIAINMATFVGSSQGGLLGAICATFGVVLPAFAVIIIVASVLKSVLKYAGVNAALCGMRPVVTALILATAVTMIISLGKADIRYLNPNYSFDVPALALTAALAAFYMLYKLFFGKSPSPILIIVLGAAAGILFFH